MKKTRSLVLFILCAGIATLAYSYIRGPKNARTGAPGESICVQSDCHVDHQVNEGPGKLSLLGVPKTYQPGTSYPIIVQLQQKGQKDWGFELTVINANLDSAGTIQRYDQHLMQMGEAEVDGHPRYYLKHTRNGIHRGESDGPVQWHFTWQAPDTSEGVISFYVAGNAGNANRKPTGDYIYQTVVKTNPGTKSQ